MVGLGSVSVCNKEAQGQMSTHTASTATDCLVSVPFPRVLHFPSAVRVILNLRTISTTEENAERSCSPLLKRMPALGDYQLDRVASHGLMKNLCGEEQSEKGVMDLESPRNQMRKNL